MLNNSKFGVGLLALALLALLAACSGSAAVPMASRAEGASPALLQSKESAPAQDVDRSKPGAAKPAPSPSDARKRIVTGSLDMQMSDLAAGVGKVSAMAQEMGGYLAASQVESAWSSLVIRIPAERYEDLVKGLSGQGKVIRAHSEAEDVTDQWFDLDNRLRTKRILLERYLVYLRQAKSVEDLLAVERQVNEVTGEIEQLEGSFKRLGNQVQYSTLTVNLSLPGSTSREAYDLGGALADFSENAAGFFQAAIVALLYVVVMGTPLVLLAALAWWLLFGKIGWIRRLFGLASGKPTRAGTTEINSRPGSPGAT